MDTVKQLKEDNQAKMEGRLEYLKSYESSHAETISMIHAALEESNEFALLKVSPLSLLNPIAVCTFIIVL